MCGKPLTTSSSTWTQTNASLLTFLRSLQSHYYRYRLSLVVGSCNVTEWSVSGMKTCEIMSISSLVRHHYTTQSCTLKLELGNARDCNSGESKEVVVMNMDIVKK